MKLFADILFIYSFISGVFVNLNARLFLVLVLIFCIPSFPSCSYIIRSTIGTHIKKKRRECNSGSFFLENENVVVRV